MSQVSVLEEIHDQDIERLYNGIKFTRSDQTGTDKM